MQLTQRIVIGALMSLQCGEFTRKAGAFLVVRNLRHADVGADFSRVTKRINRAQRRAPGVAEQYHFVFVKTPLDQFDDFIEVTQELLDRHRFGRQVGMIRTAGAALFPVDD